MKLHKFFTSRHCILPVIQAGMVWVSGAKLAAACAKAEIIGTIGVGSMKPAVLSGQLKKLSTLIDRSEPAWKRIAANIPLLYDKVDQQIDMVLEAGIETIITSAGSPRTWTQRLKDAGVTVIHVCSSPELAKKCEDAGVDLVIAEGFEAGGHNGRDEITSMVLIPQVCSAVSIPVIAAGGFASGQSVVAAQALGAIGVQMGSLFVMAQESSAHINYKNLLLTANSGDTKLMMKKHIPVRLLKNTFAKQVEELENKGAGQNELIEHLGKGRAKLGMHDGDIDQGELEIGQIISSVKSITTAQEMVRKVFSEYEHCRKNLTRS